MCEILCPGMLRHVGWYGCEVLRVICLLCDVFVTCLLCTMSGRFTIIDAVLHQAIDYIRIDGMLILIMVLSLVMVWFIVLV